VLKVTSKYEQRCFEDSFYNFLCQVPRDLQLDDSAGRKAIEFWWTNRIFSPVDIIPPCSPSEPGPPR
jgi:hypothetical protein